MSLTVLLYVYESPSNIEDHTDNSICVYKDNITHNLSTMAKESGLYDVCWHPANLNINTASDIINTLTKGLSKLKQNPDYYKKFEPTNGWGTYDNFVSFIEKYLNACKTYPNAIMIVSR